MGRDEKTPPTGTAIPRPLRPPLRAGLRPVTDYIPSDKPEPEPEPPPPPPPPPPSNPTIADVYALIDKRLSPQIVQRISSIPPSKPEPPRQSLPVRAAKQSPKWLAYVVTVIMLIGQGIAAASKEEYRGPIVQGVKLIAVAVSEWFSEDPAALPVTTPE